MFYFFISNIIFIVVNPETIILIVRDFGFYNKIKNIDHNLTNRFLGISQILQNLPSKTNDASHTSQGIHFHQQLHN